MIHQLSNVVTEIEIMNLNTTTVRLSKRESQSFIKFYKLVNLKCQISWQTQDHHLNDSDSVLDVDIIHKTTVRYNQKYWIAHSILFDFDYHDILIMQHKNEIDFWIWFWIVFYACQWDIIVQKIQIDSKILLTQNFFDKIAEDEIDWLSMTLNSWE
jgi:hypothetical protein